MIFNLILGLIFLNYYDIDIIYNFYPSPYDFYWKYLYSDS